VEYEVHTTDSVVHAVIFANVTDVELQSFVAIADAILSLSMDAGARVDDVMSVDASLTEFTHVSDQIGPFRRIVAYEPPKTG
jgi:hypothetical protein